MKRGLSSVVTIVFIIMISIAAIGILSLMLFPIVKNLVIFSGEEINLQINEAVFDSSVNSLFVSVERLADNSNLSGIQIVVLIEGNSETWEVRNNLPNLNEVRTYNLSGFEGIPSSVEIYPYAKKGNAEKLLALSDKKQVSVGPWLSGATFIDSYFPNVPNVPS